MRFLIHSNSPRVPSGYGTQTAQLARHLRDAGHEVALSCYYGQPHGMAQWEGLVCYPGGFDSCGNDVVAQHADMFFGGDRNNGWIITLTDLHSLDPKVFAPWRVLAWTPVDHVPVPADVARFLSVSDAVPVAMSRFGEEQLTLAGFSPLYAPHGIDTTVFHPTATFHHQGADLTGLEMMGAPEGAFVVMMNAMNKGHAIYDRKGFNPAFRAFARFAKDHPDAYLFVHALDAPDMGATYHLTELAAHAGIPEGRVLFSDQIAYRYGVKPELLAAWYTAADVLLAPSAGEGFGIPVIEAQACGTPVIVSDFSAQPELVGAGWAVKGELVFDSHQHASVFNAFQFAILEALNDAYETRDDPEVAEAAVRFAAQYEHGAVFSRWWEPILRHYSDPEPLVLDRSDPFEVAVLCPVLDRPANVGPLVRSFTRTNDGRHHLYLIADPADTAEWEACTAVESDTVHVIDASGAVSFAEKVNLGYRSTTAPWVGLIGDDVEFQRGWVEAAQRLSNSFDVIGTGDGGLSKRVNGPERHADHMFIRRAYIDQHGASLDGPGVVAHEGYRHFYVDDEIVALARRRGVFSPCLQSVLVHHRSSRGDATDRLAGMAMQGDSETWARRHALIGQAA